jgi:STAS domain-containing protein
MTCNWNVDCALYFTRCAVDEEQMLRITRNANGAVVFRVSGRLTGDNVAEIEALIAAEGKGRRIVLDCTDLRSVDGEAVKFLEKWEADSIKLENCGLYIREWIKRERLERNSGKSAET